MGSLSNLYISQSYQSLIHIGTNNTASATLIGLQDGLGNDIGVAVNTNGDLFLSGSLTASLQQGYLYVGNASGKTSAFATSSLVTTINTGSLVTTSSFNSYTQSINSATQSLFASASLGLTTASFSGNTLTFTKGNGTTFGVLIPDVSGSTIDTGSLVTTSSFNSYTQSTNIRLNNLESTSASVNVSISNLNSTTSSFATSIANLNTTTASLNSSVSQLNASSASQQVSIDALNVFTASQSTASIVTSINNLNTFSASALVSISNINSTTASLNSSVSQLNASSASQQVSIDALNTNSASVNTSITNLNSATQSLQGQLTTIGGQSGSWVTESETGSFARYDVSNPWSANQTFTNITATSASFTYLTTLYETASIIYSSGSNQLGDELTDIQTLSGSVKIQGGLTINGLDVTSSLNNLNSFTASQFVSNSYFATTGSNTFTGTQYITTGNNLNMNIGSNVRFFEESGVGTSAIQFWSGSSYTATNPVWVNMQPQPGGAGTLAISAFPANNHFVFFNPTTYRTQFESVIVGYGSTTRLKVGEGLEVTGSTILSGSASITGSTSITGTTNITGPVTVAGVQNINYTTGVGLGEVYLLSDSGSLVLGASNATPTYAGLTHLTSSVVNGNTNLIFKPNSNTGDTIISGSSNIFTNPAAATAGFKRYIGGSQNYYASTLPQITGSAAFSPSMNNNIMATGVIMRIPVSASAYTINGNVLMSPAANGLLLGTAAATHFEKAVSGLNFLNNIIVGGSISAVASKTSLSASVNISNNNIGGAVALNMDSSSVNIANSTIQGQLVINNSYFPTSVTAASAVFSIQNLSNLGANFVYTSGSNTTLTGAPRSITASSMLGGFNVMSASLNGDNTSLNAVHLIGQGLVAVGTNSRPAGLSAADWGSTFVGRWNSIDGVKDQTAENVFVVGTGTAEASRKTGLRIDSGSNMFVEGTLNVSGSTTMTGSLTITGSGTLNGSPIVVSNQTGSWLNRIEASTGDRLTLVYRDNRNDLTSVTLLRTTGSIGVFNSTTTQTISSNVSQSMTFDNTDITNGVTLNNSSELTVGTNGTYNIQFSAQLLADTGADTVYIWLKKNGTNVPNTGTKLVLANNEANVAAWNFVVDAVATDYFELAWQSTNGDAVLLTEGASGNIPAIPSVIVTVTQSY